MNKKGMIAIGSVAFVAIAIAGYSSLRSGQSSRGGDTSADAGHQLRVTLDPMRFEGAVRQAYQVAERDPALLAQMHCYCGCDRQEGHKNLLDCFRDEHGSKCAICVGEARDADAMAQRGVPIDQIRDTLRARYAGG